MKSFFIFDVESLGLHGEGFAVGGGLYLANGAAQWEFNYACPVEECSGKATTEEDRIWVKDNIPVLEITHRSPVAMRSAFWAQWVKARQANVNAEMAVDCGWPVEHNFLRACIHDAFLDRKACGPYPLHEISSYLSAAAYDPIGTYERIAGELPIHNPMCDARQSARIFAEALESSGSHFLRKAAI